MTSIINPETFEAAAEQEAGSSYTAGTVEVTIRNETRRVRALRKGETVTAFGLTGRYETGKKAWPASVERVLDSKTGKAWDKVEFGRDERAGRCHKEYSLFFKN